MHDDEAKTKYEAWLKAIKSVFDPGINIDVDWSELKKMYTELSSCATTTTHIDNPGILPDEIFDKIGKITTPSYNAVIDITADSSARSKSNEIKPKKSKRGCPKKETPMTKIWGALNK